MLRRPGPILIVRITRELAVVVRTKSALASDAPNA